MHRRGRKNGEKGFALLFIFALAGIAAMMLYSELPRAVFESQRAKEELLVMRGQEYQRAIQLYYRKFRKYPQTIEELEKSSGIRFLRQRYRDPMTGKDEWRMVHINAAGQFTDSKVIKPPTGQQTLGSGAAASSETPKEDPNDPAIKKRASDVGAADIGGQGGQAFAAAPASDPNAPPLAPGGIGQLSNRIGSIANVNPGYSAGVGSGTSSGGVGASVSSGGVGASSPIFPNNTNPNNTANSQNNGYPQQNVNSQRPMTADQLNPALSVIQNLLTTPRQPPPGVASANQPGVAGSSSAGSSGSAFSFGSGGANTNPSGTFGASGTGLGGNTGGIAGVASKYVGRGIKLINERERIEEWEFIYDNAKDRGGRPNSNTQSQQAGQIPGLTNGQPGGFGGQGQQQGQGGFGGQNGNRPPGAGGFGQQGGGAFGQPGGFGGNRPR